MVVADREERVRKLVDEVWNGRNYEAVANLYSETYTNPFGTGPAPRIEPIRRCHGAFVDLHLDMDSAPTNSGCSFSWAFWTARGPPREPAVVLEAIHRALI